MKQIVLALALALYAAPSAIAQTAAQPKLPTETITISGHGTPAHTFTVEMARTPQQQETGLMFRTSVPPGQGMLFDWGAPRDVPMWMKNTLVPLDMVFIGADGTVTHIAEDTVPQSLAIVPSGGPVRATLELAAGETARMDIRVGDHVHGGMFR